MTDSSANDDTTPDSENVTSILNDFVDDPSPDSDPTQSSDETDDTDERGRTPEGETAKATEAAETAKTTETTEAGVSTESPVSDSDMQSTSDTHPTQSGRRSENQTADTSPEQDTNPEYEAAPADPTDNTGSAIRQEANQLLTRVAKTGGRFVAVAMATTLSVGKRWVEGGSDPDRGLAGIFYPEDKLSESESITWADTPSRWHAVGPWSLAIFWFASAIILATTIQSGLFSTWLGSRLPGTTTVTPPQWWPSLVAGFVILGFLTVVGESLRRASTWYVVTGERIIHRRGIISSRIPVIRHNNVTSAEERNPFPLNLVNVGHIDVYTASVDGLELRINVIKQPKGRENQLNAHRDDSSDQQQETDPADQSSDTTADSDEYQGAF